MPPSYLVTSSRPHGVRELISLLAGWSIREKHIASSSMMRRFLCCFMQQEKLETGRFNYLIEEINACRKKMLRSENAAALQRYAYRHFRSTAAHMLLAQTHENEMPVAYTTVPHGHIPILSIVSSDTDRYFVLNVGSAGKNLNIILPGYAAWQCLACLCWYLRNREIPLPPVQFRHIPGHHQLRSALFIEWSGTITTAGRWIKSEAAADGNWYDMASRWTEALAKLEWHGFTITAPILDNLWLAGHSSDPTPAHMWINPAVIAPVGRIRGLFRDTLAEKLDSEIHVFRKKLRI